MTEIRTQLPPTIAANIDRFTGRTWLLPPLLDWLEHGDERVFLITGGPGTGKSMITAWLAGRIVGICTQSERVSTDAKD